MNRAMLIVALAVGLIAWGSWLFRYGLTPTPSSNYPAAYLLDRWTGSTYFTITYRDWNEVKFEKPLKVVSEEPASAPAAKSRNKYPWEANDPVVSESAPAAKSRDEKPGK